MSTSDTEFVAFYESSFRDLVDFGNCLKPGRGEDLAQTVCERIWRGQLRYGADDLRPVAFRAIRNLVHDERRRDRVVGIDVTDFSDPSGIGGSCAFSIADDTAEIAQLTVLIVCRFIGRRWDDTHRAVLVLRWLDEFNETEIATATGLSRRSVRTHLRRGRHQLRAEVGFELELSDSA